MYKTISVTESKINGKRKFNHVLDNITYVPEILIMFDLPAIYDMSDDMSNSSKSDIMRGRFKKEEDLWRFSKNPRIVFATLIEREVCAPIRWEMNLTLRNIEDVYYSSDRSIPILNPVIPLDY